MRSRLAVSPTLYARITLIALVALSMIVVTGAAVRLTGSGLGCPDWPKCYGHVVAPLEFHAVIEYGNRLITGIVGIVVIAAAGLAWFRKPFRWHLALFGAFLPLGVMGQAVLGALVVEQHLNPNLVIGHYILSMILLDAAFALAWCARYAPDERRRSSDRLGVWSVRALVPIGQLTILLGTITTGSGPHPGDFQGDLVKRFDFRGGETLRWMVERHGAMAAIFGLATLAVWLILRRKGADRRALRPVTVLLGLLAAQGALGIAQYALKLPAGLVWVHIVLAVLTWLAVLWSVGTAGRLEPRGERAGAPAGPQRERELVSAA
jgi:cytochrome c oxidase assembly protein subunit 15